MAGESMLAGRMVFLVGARRSGTNWLHRMLRAHPAIFGVPSETHLFDVGLPPLVGQFHEGSPSSLTTTQIYMPEAARNRALRAFCDEVFIGLRDALDPGAELILERTPWHARRLDLIHGIYPDAAIIHIIRDGRDSIRSLMHQAYGPDDVDGAAEEWRSCVSMARESGPRFERYREVRYEDLMADPDGGMAELFTWLGVPLHAAEETAVEQVHLAGAVEFNVDVQDPRIEVGKWRGNLTPHQLARIDAIAGDELRTLGYWSETDMAAALAEAPSRPANAPSPSPSPRDIVRSLAMRVRPGARPAAPDAVPRTGHLVQRRQRTLDAVLESFNKGKAANIVSLLTPTAEITVVRPEGEWTGRGERARADLLAVLEEDRPDVGTRPVRADLHARGTALVAVLSYDDGQGGARDLLIVADADDAGVSSFAYYRFPLPGAAPTTGS